MTPAEILRAAAVRVRAQPDHTFRMSAHGRAVALAVADLLDAHAAVAESNDEHDGFDLAAIDDTHVRALAVARALLPDEETQT